MKTRVLIATAGLCAGLLGVAGMGKVLMAEPPHDEPAHGQPASTGHAPASKPGAKSDHAPKAAQPKAAQKPAGTHEDPKPGSDHAQDGHGDDGHEQEARSEGDKGHGKPAKAAKAIEAKPATKPAKAAAKGQDEPVTAEAALELLAEGNQRWVTGKPQNPNIESSRREDLAANGQKPFAAFLTCADSRLPVERIVDRGVGDVFVVRVAGNTAQSSETGTLEYAVEHLHVPVIVVMGHTSCGAVKAACAGGAVHGALGEIIEEIAPAVERAKAQDAKADDHELLEAAIRENVWQSVFNLIRTSPVVRDALAKGEVKIVGAVCELSTGEITWMGEHPWQRELVSALSPSNSASANAEEGHH